MKVGRNERCPCGSGLKFKKCCLSQPLPTDVVLTLGGKLVKKERVVAALCWQIDGGIKIVGTAFFIGNDGLFVTAKHNVDEFADGVWEKPGQGPILYQLGEDKQFHPRPIMELRKHPTSDVAIGVTFMSFHKQTGAVLAAPALPISLETPAVGSMVTTIAFPGSYFASKNGPLVLEPDFGAGKVQSIFDEAGRCESRPGRGFQSTLHLKSGASGGPVFNYQGRVVGVVSSGLDPQPPYPAVGFVQSIEEIMPLSLQSLRVEGDGEDNIPTIGDLAARNILVANFDFRQN